MVREMRYGLSTVSRLTEFQQLSILLSRSTCPQLLLAMFLFLRKVIDRQQFEVVVHARMGARPFAKERIAPYR